MLLCPPLSLRVCSNPCPFSEWHCLTISSSVVLFSPCLQSFPARTFLFCFVLFYNESVLCVKLAKFWSFSISASNEYSELISFSIDCFDPLAIQGTLKSLLQHHSSKASIVHHSASFIVQLSHPYMTIGKSRALTTQVSVNEVMSLLFNTLSWFVITFLPKKKHLLISWLQSLSPVILESWKIKSVIASTLSPSICHEGQFIFQSQRRAIANNVQIDTPALISHASKVMLKMFHLGFNSTWTECPDVQALHLENAKEPEIKFPTSVSSQEKQENFRNKQTNKQKSA